MSDDPLRFGAGDLNLQRYVGNNPITFTDPDGMLRKEMVNRAGNDPLGVSAASSTRRSWMDRAAEEAGRDPARVAAAYAAVNGLPAYNGPTIQAAGAPGLPLTRFDYVAEYIADAREQVVLGEYSNKVNALGTALQVGTGIIGIDLPGDLRDLSHNFRHWEWSGSHAGKTLVNAIGILPVIGAMKYGDEVGEVVNGGRKNLAPTSQSVAGRALLPREGQVGTYDDLIAAGEKGDNLTPHHIPSAEHMLKHDVPNGKGISINMEHPYPGSGGIHRSTFTYGTKVDKDMSSRDALSAGVRDVRNLYRQDGLYGSYIRQQVQEIIRQNKTNYPDAFKKETRTSGSK